MVKPAGKSTVLQPAESPVLCTRTVSFDLGGPKRVQMAEAVVPRFADLTMTAQYFSLPRMSKSYCYKQAWSSRSLLALLLLHVQLLAVAYNKSAELSNSILTGPKCAME